MFNFFSKKHLSALLALLSLTGASSLTAQDYYYPQMQDDCCYSYQDCCLASCNRFYIGGFGGALYSDSTRMVQLGTAFFTEAAGGPMAIDASGNSGRNSAGFGGVQIGYEWKEKPFSLGCMGCSDWNISPAAEFEAYWYKHSKHGDLINPTTRLPEHDFVDTFPMNVGVYLLNGVFALNSCHLGQFSPYVGGGVGVANIFIRHADSLQVSPPEVGVNHFNSDRSDSSWAFAAQAKAGLRYNICDRVHLFGEYRFLYVDTSRYIFGGTITPTHAPTSPWNVEIKNICYNGFAFGLQFDL